MIPQELLDQLNRISELAGEELDALLTALQALSDQLLDEPDTTDETLESLREVSGYVRQVTDRQTELEQAATDRATERDRLRDEIRRMTGQDEGDPADPAAGDPADPAADPAAVDPAADPAAPVPEPVAAAGTPRGGARANARRPAQRPAAMTPAPAPQAPLQLVATGAWGNVQGGQVLTPATFADALVAAADQSRGYHGPRVKIPVARLGRGVAEYPEDRQLGRDSILNARRVAAVQAEMRTPAAIAASGGICAPINVRYDLPIVGEDARPFRDTALMRFGADRGGVKTLVPPVIEDLDDAIGFWTEANDQTPSSPSVKPCLTISCGDETDETLVQAITKCLETGNFRSKFFPEQIDAWTNLATTNLARQAETEHIGVVAAASLQVVSGQVLGVTRDVLTTIDRATAAMMSRHRDRMLRFRFCAPFYLRDMMRVDIARQMPVGTWDETLAAADAKLDALFAARPVSVTWLLDGEAGQVFAQQGDGALIGWPSTIITYLYLDGTWLFLDGGTIDFGIIRDSTLIGTNDFRMMAESFEGVHFHGVPNTSMRLVMDVCPDGSAGALIDINPCATGS